jgi:hypothetical protein
MGDILRAELCTLIISISYAKREAEIRKAETGFFNTSFISQLQHQPPANFAAGKTPLRTLPLNVLCEKRS